MSIESAGVDAERPTSEAAQSPPLERSDRAQAGAASEGASSAGRLEPLRSYAVQRRVAAGLGWFSIGLGLFELAAPRALARLVGIERPEPRWSLRLMDRRSGSAIPLILRGLGVREVLSGVGILTRPRPAAWLWSRVVGDAMDLSLLGLALSSRRTDRVRLSGATAAVLGITALDVLSSLEFTRMHRRTRRSWSVSGRGVPVEAYVLVNRPPEQCYRLWRELENLPRFMRSVESVRVESERRSHWVAKAPGGMRVEWDSEITHDTPSRLIAWRSTSADVPNAGSVHFDPAPGGRGTLVRVRMTPEMPGGALSRLAARLLGKLPEVRIREDLRRFKQILEAGEIPTTRGQRIRAQVEAPGGTGG